MPRWNRLSRLTSALVLTGVASAVLLGQEPTFKTGTEIVSLFVTVVDAQGRLVPDLTKDDFEILDNDKVQPIIYFENIIQPISVVVMLDTSGSMTGSISLLKDAAEQFLLRLLPADQGRVGAFNDKIQISAHFTKNRDELIGDVKELDYGNGTRLWDAVLLSLEELKGIEGRRVVLVFTDGKDEPAYDQDRTKFQAVKDHAIENEVMIYAIAVPAQVVGAGAIVMGRQYGGGTKYEPPNKQLRELADATGGGHLPFDWAQNLDVIFTRVADELHRQYLIGFSPVRLDGKVHQISVNSKKSGLTVRARQSYVAEGQ